MSKHYQLIVVGAGAAGMSAAIAASDCGIKDIIVIERDHQIGGILNQCFHQGFGLLLFGKKFDGPGYVNTLGESFKKRQIKCELNSLVAKIEPIDQGYQMYYTNQDGYHLITADAIIFATGCSEKTRGGLALSGDRPSGVLNCGLAQRYLNLEKLNVGKKVFILGSGDIGLITAKLFKDHGSEVLGVAEIMPYSNGLPENLQSCLYDQKIPLYLSHTVKEVRGKTRIKSLVLVKVDQDLKLIPGTEQEIEVDTLLLAVGLIPYNPILEKAGAKINPRTKGPIVDQNYQTSLKGVFACGNAVHVHDLVDYVSMESYQVGKMVAQFIIKKVKDNKKVLQIKYSDDLKYVVPQHIQLPVVTDFQISFRVNQPLTDVEIEVIQNYQVIASRKVKEVIPAHLEKITINKNKLAKNGNLTILIKK